MDKKACKSIDVEVRKGPWTMEEDLILMNYIANHGEGVWNSLARSAGKLNTHTHIYIQQNPNDFFFFTLIFDGNTLIYFFMLYLKGSSGLEKAVVCGGLTTSGRMFDVET